MMKIYQSGLDLAPANFAAVGSQVARMMLLMFVSILTVGGDDRQWLGSIWRAVHR